MPQGTSAVALWLSDVVMQLCRGVRVLCHFVFVCEGGGWVNDMDISRLGCENVLGW